jgi:hypothetical protein
VGRGDDQPVARPALQQAEESPLCGRVQVGLRLLDQQRERRFLCQSDDDRHEQLLDTGAKIFQVQGTGAASERHPHLVPARRHTQLPDVRHDLSDEGAHPLEKFRVVGEQVVQDAGEITACRFKLFGTASSLGALCSDAQRTEVVKAGPPGGQGRHDRCQVALA